MEQQRKIFTKNVGKKPDNPHIKPTKSIPKDYGDKPSIKPPDPTPPPPK